jgi:transcriptional regulator with PAS, ATPase and Fis domain
VISVSPEVMGILMRHDFPGNVRELENIIEYCFVVCHGGIIQKEHLPVELISSPTELLSSAEDLRDPLSEAISEKSHIESTLARNGGNKTKAARDLGIHRTTLWRKLRRYGIAPSP